jgi:copper transport protein
VQIGRAIAVAGALAVAGTFALAPAVSAHALPQSAIPAEGSEVQTAPGVVEITFGETPDPRLSSITVVNGSGLSVDAGPTVAVPGHPLELEVPVKPIGTGVYTVTWKTVSEVDGHLATGAYAFGVGVSATSANAHAARSVVSPPPSLVAVMSRWLFFIGLMGIVGVASTCVIALRTVPPFATRALVALWLVAALGVAGVVEAEREAAGVPWASVFTTSLGTVLIQRIAALLVTAAGIAALAVLRANGRDVAVAVTGIGAAASMYVDVAASHAGAQAPVAANLLAQWAHIAAGGVWIGGLLALIVAVRGQPSEVKGQAVRRFSTTAGVAIVVVALTGTFRAVI